MVGKVTSYMLHVQDIYSIPFLSMYTFMAVANHNITCKVITAMLGD
jgi:hypothetical protein